MNSKIIANKKWWNNVTKIHAKSKLYDVSGFKKGKTSLQKLELKELNQVNGKSMLHLMCHFGLDTLSWARKGAVVTGVDISDESIKLATTLAKENKIKAEFICSDIYDLPKVLDKKYDIVYMSYGVFLWLSDFVEFAKIVAYFLKKGGTFYVVEVHPFTNNLTYDFKLDYKYFDKGPYVDDSSGTYTDWNADIKGVTHQWSYTMSDIINGLIEAGLEIKFIHEFPYTMYEQFPGLMKKNKNGQFFLKNKKIEVPLLFSIKAVKI